MGQNSQTSKDEFLYRLQEWKEHQYDPGHYTGGNIPPVLTHIGRPFVIGWFFIISSILFCALTVIMVIRSFDKEQILPITVVITVTFGFYTIQFFAGVRLIKKGTIQNKNKVINKKIIILTVTILIVTISLFMGAYHMNNHNEELIITSMEQVVLKQVNNNNFVYIKSIDKKLSCSIDEYFSLWSLKTSNDSDRKKTTLKLEFVWNNFNPKQGKIIKITK